jgi:spore photoproduct lyase
VEIFRTTPAKTVCPNFYVLAHANGCTFAPVCSYCYLKSSFWYLNGAQAFTNVDKMVDEARAWIARDNLESYVLNTGNLSDSLTFEDHRPLVSQLVQLFREEAEAKGRQHALLLVTKEGVRGCQPLFEMEPCRNVIVSFSVNSPQAAKKHEAGAARVADRLAAARRLKSHGWRVRMRLDPIILGFDYAWVTEQLKQMEPERLTLGTLRAEANLLRCVDNGLFTALEEPDDPKALARYPLDQRLALYRPVVEAMSAVCPIGLCEETPDVWDALGLDAAAKSCNCGS